MRTFIAIIALASLALAQQPPQTLGAGGGPPASSAPAVPAAVPVALPAVPASSFAPDAPLHPAPVHPAPAPAPVPAPAAAAAASPSPASRQTIPARFTEKKHKVDAAAPAVVAPVPGSNLRPAGASGDRKPFICPEVNGLFPDAEQCDLYYICEKNVVTEVLCDDGLLFDDSIRNREKCVLPHNVDCGDRVYVQEPTPGIDARCQRANGFFDHEDPHVCDKFYSCDKGTAFEMPCAQPLHFDVKIGSCVRVEQLSEDSKKCGDGQAAQAKEIDGFTCPGKEEIGPHGLLQQHPVFPHPSDCQFFFTCFFGKEPNKFGCSGGQVFDAKTQVCKEPKEVPECSCWYSCDEKSKCPDSCNADCSCPN